MFNVQSWPRNIELLGRFFEIFFGVSINKIRGLEGRPEVVPNFWPYVENDLCENIASSAGCESFSWKHEDGLNVETSTSRGPDGHAFDVCG